ncbi:MAG TPA: DUF4843 domain-containing protein [Chitinophagaceae bacterium]|nr:DUF4843 domain-containing protein [Chitinophagaceae bacterium]
MSKLKISLFILLASISLMGCVKNEEVIFTGAVIEFDATTWNANAAGVNYPILTRVPPFRRAVNTSVDPVLNKNSGTVKIRINLVGPQRTTDTEITYQVLAANTTAVAGTHYTALPGKVIIPANSSFGDIDLQILPTAGTPPPSSVDLVLELTGGTNVTVSPNYNRIGLRIAQ